MPISETAKDALSSLRVVLGDNTVRILHPQGGAHAKADTFDSRVYITSTIGNDFEDIFFDRVLSPVTIDAAPKGGLNSRAVTVLAAIRAVLVSESITLRNDQGTTDGKVTNRFSPRLDVVSDTAGFSKELFQEGGLTVDELTKREAS